MENASKALIIAGAILISILLIGLGVYVYQIAASTTGRADLSSQEAQAFNSQFSSFYGSRVSAAQVKSLMSAIRTQNITSNTAQESNQIYVLYNGVKSTTTDITQKVTPGHIYWVNTENENAATDEELNKGTDALDKNSASYYNTGFVRIISVYEDKYGNTGTK